MQENTNKIEELLEEMDFEFDMEELEEVVTPGCGFGCDC